MEQNYTEDDFIKGISHFGQQQQKKQLDQIQAELEQEGFFEQNTDLVLGIAQQGEKELRKNIVGVQSELEKEGFFQNNTTTTKRKSLPLFRVVLAAASITLLIWVGRSWLLTDNNSINNIEIVAIEDIDEAPTDFLSENIAKELSESGFGGAPPRAILEELQVAMQNYQKEEYLIASQQLKSILDNPIPHPFVEFNKFYLAISYLETEKAVEAIGLLEQLQRSEKMDQNAIKWYLALAFQKTGQTAKAKATLTDWQPFGDYKLKKQQLLDIIK